jgi:hypothetical protein
LIFPPQTGRRLVGRWLKYCSDISIPGVK